MFPTLAEQGHLQIYFIYIREKIKWIKKKSAIRNNNMGIKKMLCIE